LLRGLSHRSIAAGANTLQSHRPSAETRHGIVAGFSISLRLREYAILTTAEVRKHLPDVHAMRKGTTIVWRRGNAVATLNASAADHWRLDVGSCTYHERHDARAAHVAASNIVVHFDIRYCRGIRVPPYTDEELARSAAFRAKRGVA
jgi:hypothetical protein